MQVKILRIFFEFGTEFALNYCAVLSHTKLNVMTFTVRHWANWKWLKIYAGWKLFFPCQSVLKNASVSVQKSVWYWLRAYLILTLTCNNFLMKCHITNATNIHFFVNVKPFILTAIPYSVYILHAIGIVCHLLYGLWYKFDIPICIENRTC